VLAFKTIGIFHSLCDFLIVAMAFSADFSDDFEVRVMRCQRVRRHFQFFAEFILLEVVKNIMAWRSDPKWVTDVLSTATVSRAPYRRASLNHCLSGWVSNPSMTMMVSRHLYKPFASAWADLGTFPASMVYSSRVLKKMCLRSLFSSPYIAILLTYLCSRWCDSVVGRGLS